MNQTSTISIGSLSIGDIVKIPSLPNINSMTILNINQCGTRVKGSETTNREHDNSKTICFDHNISNSTPVVKIGVDEGVINKYVEKMREKDLEDTDFGVENQNNSENGLDTEEKSDTLEEVEEIAETNNNLSNNNLLNIMSEQNNQDTQSTAVNNVVKAIAQTVAVAKQVADSKNEPNYFKPTGSFSAKLFSEQNHIPYGVGLAYLKLNAKEVGKESKGRGRPTILYSFE